MAIITNNYFIVKVKYTRQLDNGAFKRVTEPYLVAGFSFTDAEASIYENLGSVIRGEFTVTDIKRVEYHDIFDETGGTAFLHTSTPIVEYYTTINNVRRTQHNILPADSLDWLEQKESLTGSYVTGSTAFYYG